MMSGRTFRVKPINESSPHRPVGAGVRQGSLLGPKLFILYTSDIPHIPHHHPPSPKLVVSSMVPQPDFRGNVIPSCHSKC